MKPESCQVTIIVTQFENTSCAEFAARGMQSSK